VESGDCGGHPSAKKKLMVEMGVTWVEMAGVLVTWVAWLHRLHEEEGGLSQEHYGEAGAEELHGR
jgi:hypothetical protein